MFRILILCILLIACNNNKPKSENLASSKDSTTLHKADTSFPKLNTTEQSENYSDFLSNSKFNDTIQVKNIQQYITKIDKIKFKDSIYLENEEFMNNMTDGGGSLTGYFDNNKLIRIAEWIGLSWGVLQVNYYFNNDDLVFVRETEDHFYINDSTGTDHSRFDSHFRGEYYFNKGKLFDEVSLGHNRFENENENAQKEYNKRAKENRNIILNRKKRR